MEVLGAVASAATLAQIAVKGVEFLQKIPEIKSDYDELCDELEFIDTIIRVAQKTSTHSEKTTPMRGIQDQFGRIISTLTEISRGLDEIKTKCQHQTATGDVRVSKKKWMMFGGKIGGMLQKAHRAKTNLQMSIAMHMSTLHHQTNAELREVKCRLELSLPGIERQLDHMSHAAMVMISTQEQILNGQTENSQRIQELDDEGNELDSNNTSAITDVQGSITPDAPPQTRVLPWASDECGYLIKSVADIRQAMDKGMVLFPDDGLENGFDIIEFLVLMKNFQVLEFLLLQWNNVLVNAGLSRNAGYRTSYLLRFNSIGEPGVRVLEQIVSYSDLETDVATSAIHEAAIRGSGVQESCVGAKHLIDALDETGFAPLHQAIMRGHTQAVQDLIDAGADVNCKTFDEQTPLMWAAQNGQTENMRRLLLTRRIRIDERDSFKNTALHCAAGICDPEAVRLLLEAGASPSLPSIWGRFPLHRVVESENENPAEIAATINLLLDAPGTDINATDNYGDTAIMLAVENNKHVALRCLVQAGPSFTTINKYSRTVLHYAAWYGDLDILHFLDGQQLTCINWRLPNNKGWTPWLSFMLRCNHPKWKPDAAEMIAFVQLYRGIRDRDLAHDISLLEQTLAALDHNDVAKAHLSLSAIIQSKEAYNDKDSARFYRGFRGHLSCGNKETLSDNIQADLQELRFEMASSPWDRDPFDESDSDESLSDSDESLSDSDKSSSDSEDFSESSIRTESHASNRD
uniref:Fungal N-terminal domain-containing protein n=1 Tax=Bionectria ochroleuca TaxID=29856 RepID=A0A8H7N1Z0_BIOOC